MRPRFTRLSWIQWIEMLPLLHGQNLTRRFGALTALNRVSLAVRAGEVVGLAGRSGSGKTVLMRVLAGLQAPDEGRLVFDGRPLSWPFQAAQAGIGLIQQEPTLADQFDITANIFLGHELTWTLLGKRINILNQRKMHEEARRLLALLDVEFPSLHLKAADLSSESRQLVAIAQGMAAPAQLRLVDDPTALLSAPYQNKLLSLIDSWRREGIAVLFSSQNLDHLFAVADRLIVLRQGEVAADLRSDETNREEIVAAMVGTGERQQYTPVIWALDSYYQAKQQAEALHHNQLLLEHDLEVRDSLNQQLLAQLSEQVQALDKVNLALQDAQRRLLTEREMERKHLARELHDETIQDLLSLNYQLEEVAALADGNENLVIEVDDVRHHIRQLVSNIRAICGDLRPHTIDSLGLGAALQSYTQTWRDRTGIAVTLALNGNFGRLPEAIELSIFRIVQEGLNNVWKHSGASQVCVTLNQASPRLLHLVIADDGTGLLADFDMAALSRSGNYGLLGISERVALMGGRLTLQNQPRGGLLIQAEIPHPRAQPPPLD
jgi:signal transduction histidine kinase